MTQESSGNVQLLIFSQSDLSIVFIHSTDINSYVVITCNKISDKSWDKNQKFDMQIFHKIDSKSLQYSSAISGFKV